ncbi:MTH1187 family thiamine-binding protein [Consotaella salsifontis]|uniref:Uncharacterized protein, MTH1187 family n=1 Tax=Consotaella salsifontis TaxID=1365950 RepID=A0A1T4SJ20_9HYPH|nr:MTH1187 family thiamine-binding protein [Consotaella salsifontis]SKA28192.1 uncharacterized protein, MTH1187 family [Consotaella salsifontis]
MVLLEFAMYPISKGESLSAYVARTLDIIDKSGVTYRLTPMGTILEGEWNEVMAVVTECFEAMRAECPRVEVALKVDYREGTESRLESKITSVEHLLGRKMKTV